MKLTRKLACPSCQVTLKVADSLPAGKKIRCPKCDHGFAVPAEEEEVASAAVNGIRRQRATLPREEEDDDEEAEERRPRKRKRRPKKKASNTPLIVGLIAIAVLLVLGAGATLAWVFWPSGKKDTAVAQNNPPSSAPSAARPDAGGPGPGKGPEPRGGMNPGKSRPGPAPGAGNAPSRPDAGAAASGPFAAGQAVFQKSCARCHTVIAGGRSRAPNLSKVGADPAHTVAWFEALIRNPESQKPGARMPPFEGKISDTDLRALAEYLASLK
jgi:predicted Zn finger-like uncharacterized protein